MTFKDTTINGRLPLMSARTDKFKTDMFTVTLAVPRSRTSQADIALLSSVLLRGTEKYPSSKLIDKRLDELYASDIDIKFMRFGNIDTMNISCEFLGSRFTENGAELLDDILGMIDQLLFCPLTDSRGFFREDITEREKKNVTDGIKAVINHPDSYAGARCLEIMKRFDPDFATLDGAAERIGRHDGASLNKFFEVLKKSAAVRFFYIGRSPAELVENKISETFGGRFSGNFSGKTSGASLGFSPAAADKPAPYTEKTEHMSITQGKLAIGLRSGVSIADENFYSAVIFNEIFGASPASKLFTNVREKYGLCYYCDSSLNIYTGNILVSSGINPENRKRATDAIFHELENMKNGKISARELDTAKKSTVNYYRQIYDKMPETFNFYTGRRLNGINAAVADCTDSFAEVTKESVVEIARGITADTVYFLEGVE